VRSSPVTTLQTMAVCAAEAKRVHPSASIGFGGSEHLVEARKRPLGQLGRQESKRWIEPVCTLTALPTRLWPLPMADRKCLVNWGYVVSDLALRAFIWRAAAPPSALPFPDADFAQAPMGSPALHGKVL
jgi:hypothetical protein